MVWAVSYTHLDVYKRQLRTLLYTGCWIHSDGGGAPGCVPFHKLHKPDVYKRQIQYIADALPDDKEEFVRQLQLQRKTVAMVGDGINDSQALACADVDVYNRQL